MNTAIIGGGASGLAAAITASEDRNNNIIVFERQQRVGKKLSVTGNGRCNLTNTGAGIRNYHGASPEFVLPALTRFPPQDNIAFFRHLGLLTVEEYGGRVYPLSDSANSVVDVLRFAAESRGVEMHLAEEIRTLSRNGGRFLLTSDAGKYEADRVIVCCGGIAGAKAGGTSSGYELLAGLGHKKTKLYPSLVQLTTDSDYPRSLRGVRADAEVRLMSGKSEIARSAGELQFTEKGISGPVTFDISRAAAPLAGSGITVHIDFFRDYTRKDITDMLERRCASQPGLSCDDLLTGMLQNRIGRMMFRYSGIEKKESIGVLTRSELERISAACTDFTMTIKGTENFDSAQVTAGGIDVSGFDPGTLESRLVRGLYACGEVLDIDGDCGGYNLQWAWSSGRLAGSLGK